MFSSYLNLVADGCGHNWPPCTGPFLISLEPRKEEGLKPTTVCREWGVGARAGFGGGVKVIWLHLTAAARGRVLRCSICVFGLSFFFSS